MVTLTCINCGKTFDVINSRKNAKFCCKKCEGEYKTKTSTETRICECCGKEFSVLKSSNVKFCSYKCMGASKTNKVKKICICCGNEFEVIKARENSAMFCCRKCSDLYRRAKPNTFCAYCGKPIYRKPSHISKHIHGEFCSYDCLNKWKEIAYCGNGNHQFGLKGELNSSFKGQEITCKNANQIDDLIYMPEHPRANNNGRVRKYIVLVEQNYFLFDEKYFYSDGQNHYLKEGVVVHHIDQNHNNNDISNLIPLTISEHTKLHIKLGTYNYIKRDKLGRFTAVLKQGELLETPEVDNQQPSIPLTKDEGSETNT